MLAASFVMLLALNGCKAGRRNADERKIPQTHRDPIWLKALLGALAFGFIAVLLLLPLVLVFKEALGAWAVGLLGDMTEPETLAAVRLSLTAAAYRGAAQYRGSAFPPPGPSPSLILRARPSW
jgi:hypothetical protein